MKQIKKILNPYKRKLILANKEWTYRITHKTIEICNPERTKKYKFLYDGVLDDGSCNCDGDPDCCCDYSATYVKLGPGYVKKLIEGKILKKK
jgi:hypothetical protein